jgi:hypothetical protein
MPAPTLPRWREDIARLTSLLAAALLAVSGCQALPQPVEDQRELENGSETATASSELARAAQKGDRTGLEYQSSARADDRDTFGFDDGAARPGSESTEEAEATPTPIVVRLQRKGETLAPLLVDETGSLEALADEDLSDRLDRAQSSGRPLRIEVPVTVVDAPEVGSLLLRAANAGYTEYHVELTPVSVPGRPVDEGELEADGESGDGASSDGESKSGDRDDDS